MYILSNLTFGSRDPSLGSPISLYDLYRVNYMMDDRCVICTWRSL